ncbi:MAG: hypothetical protein ACR2LM_13550 [Pyrinomonadaceae bacterium]
MKRCPECYEVYENFEKFCELDGQPLLADPALSAADVKNTQPGPEGLHLNRASWLTGIIGVMAGIVICVGVYTAYTLGSMEEGSKNQEAPVHASRMQNQLQQMRPAPARIPEPEPEAEPAETPSPELQVEPSPESSAPTTNGAEGHTVAARLNQGPVSTGPRSRDGKDGERIQTIIQMNDGTTVEVDAAWEDRQGVWYRRGGLVSFVERNLVKSISESVPRPTPDTVVTP